MSQRLLRSGLLAFVALTIGVLVNLTVLQTRTAVRVTEKVASGAAGLRERQLALDVAKSGPQSGMAGRLASALRSDTPAAQPIAGDQAEIVRAVQRELQARGYFPVAHDGVVGMVTRAAIMAFEHDNGLPLTGEPSEDLLKRILLGTAAVPASEPSKEKRAPADTILRSVQQTLSGLGYDTGKADGRLGDDTQRAIREFETDNKMPETGRVSAQLVMRLAKLAGSSKLTASR